MIEDGMIMLYNISSERVTKVINGTRISIPAHGSVNISERKGRVMLETFPDKLTEDSNYDKHQYSQDDFDMLAMIDEEGLRNVCRVLMSGERPDLARAVFDTEERKNAKLNKKS